MSSFGSINTQRKLRHGECSYCSDENWARDHHWHFEPRQRMIGPVCGHRLHIPKQRSLPQFKVNAISTQLRLEHAVYRDDYWHKRALLPDWWGEPGELCPGAANDLLIAGTRVSDASEQPSIRPAEPSS